MLHYVSHAPRKRVEKHIYIYIGSQLLRPVSCMVLIIVSETCFDLFDFQISTYVERVFT